MSRSLERQRRFHTRLVWIGAVLLCIVPVLVIGGTVLGMFDSLHVIETTNAPTPADLVRTTVRAYCIALAVGLFGAGLFVPSLIALHRIRRAPAPTGVAP